jgi:hypothetical protein
MGEARALLELEREAGELGADAFDRATDSLRGLFELFQDDDVLNVYNMREPADAAVAGASDLTPARCRPGPWEMGCGSSPESRPKQRNLRAVAA